MITYNFAYWVIGGIEQAANAMNKNLKCMETLDYREFVSGYGFLQAFIWYMMPQKINGLFNIVCCPVTGG